MSLWSLVKVNIEGARRPKTLQIHYTWWRLQARKFYYPQLSERRYYIRLFATSGGHIGLHCGKTLVVFRQQHWVCRPDLPWKQICPTGASYVALLDHAVALSQQRKKNFAVRCFHSLTSSQFLLLQPWIPVIYISIPATSLPIKEVKTCHVPRHLSLS